MPGFDQWKRLNDENERKHKAVIFHNLWSKFCRSKKIKARPKDGKVFKERQDSNWWDDRRMVGRRLNAPHSHPPPHARPIHVPPSHRPIAPLRSALPGRFFLQETNRPSIFLQVNQKKFCEHQVLGEFLDTLKFNKTKLAQKGPWDEVDSMSREIYSMICFKQDQR